MRNLKFRIQKSRLLWLLVITLPFLGACSSEDTGSSGEEVQTATGEYFIAVKASSGTEYVMQAESLESGTLNINQNIMELPQQEYTWIFRDDLAIGMVYQQQFAGIGYALRIQSDLSLEKMGEFSISTRFSNYGFFEDYLVTSVAGQVSSDGSRNDGAVFAFWDLTGSQVSLDYTKTVWTEDITGNGQQITFSSIIDMDNGEFLTSMVQSDFKQTGTGTGSSVGTVHYPDSVWVAAFDADLNLLRVYRDDRISYSAGQYRSQVFPQMGKADDGTVYVFSSSFDENATLPCGALRILKGAEEFDPDYYYNIDDETGGYTFRRVWHMTGDKFLLEIYNSTGKPGMTDPGHQFAVVDMGDKSFVWVTGIPAKNLITSGTETGGVPMYYGGTIYLPITEFGQDAAVYLVNPTTGVATKGVTLTGVSEIRSLGHLTPAN
ncbi:MAG: DUF4374 domain-containing protein [Bacteroides sp.]|nr:DUF4374 domain-containing protein [Bacteroides sp.]